MIKEWKELWVAALRSGDYNQGKGYLTQIEPVGDEREEQFDCCLGVLCKVIVKEKPGFMSVEEKPLKLNGLETSFREVAYDTRTAQLPLSVSQLVGLESQDPEVAYKDGRVNLSVLNDTMGLDFNTIADIIEEDL